MGHDDVGLGDFADYDLDCMEYFDSADNEVSGERENEGGKAHGSATLEDGTLSVFLAVCAPLLLSKFLNSVRHSYCIAKNNFV